VIPAELPEGVAERVQQQAARSLCSTGRCWNGPR
jgi:hypothetical protein